MKGQDIIFQRHAGPESAFSLFCCSVRTVVDLSNNYEELFCSLIRL